MVLIDNPVVLVFWCACQTTHLCLCYVGVSNSVCYVGVSNTIGFEDVKNLVVLGIRYFISNLDISNK